MAAARLPTFLWNAASSSLRASKNSTTHPSNEPSAAMLAYSGMRAGCCIDNSINNKSLITGKVKNDESKNEIKNSPGAPSVPANPTIFCFQAPSCAGNEACSLLPVLLRKRPAIKMTHEHLHQRRAMQVRQSRNLPNHPHMSKSLNRVPVLPLLVADQHAA